MYIKRAKRIITIVCSILAYTPSAKQYDDLVIALSLYFKFIELEDKDITS